MYRIPEKQMWSWMVLNYARSCFDQYANYWYLFFHQTKISWLFYNFLICLVSFYIFLWKHNSFMWIYAFKRKTTLRKCCVYSHSKTCLFHFTCSYTQITLNHSVDFGLTSPTYCSLLLIFLCAQSPTTISHIKTPKLS